MSRDTHYTFGDGQLARERLRLLAQLYDPATEDLLRSFGPRGVSHAVDLGCGPGHTTRLLHRVLAPVCTTGLDSSMRYVSEARADPPAGVRFEVHDVTRAPFPVPRADVLLCRYLLTHLRSPERALDTWAHVANPGAVLLVQETEYLASETPVLARYYELVAELQRRCGQAFDVGPLVDAALLRGAWHVRVSRVHPLSPDARAMARLHVMNLRTWRDDPMAVEAFDRAELLRLEDDLSAISEGRVACPPVRQGLREVVAVRG
jgi:trans-aconitate 2-methyltransferase